jgi:hypothetical protein
MTDYPIARHDPADWDREYLLDVAAAAKRDSWPLVGCRDLVEAICRDYGAIALELQDARRSAHRSALTDARTYEEYLDGKRAYEARLYEVRRLLAWGRRPWWDRLITRMLGGGP